MTSGPVSTQQHTISGATQSFSPEANSTIAEVPIPKSDLYTLRATPGAGRGVFALKSIECGTLLFRTSRSSPEKSCASSHVGFDGVNTTSTSRELLSPTAYTILRPYRIEVCAECFAYDRGRKWKVKVDRNNGEQNDSPTIHDPGVVFCTEACRDGWLERYGEIGVGGFAAVESMVKKLANRKKRRSRQADEEVARTKAATCGASADAYHFEEVNQRWKMAEKSALQILHVRKTQIWSKPVKRLARAASEPEEVDADILYYLLTGVLNSYLSSHDPKPSDQAVSSQNSNGGSDNALERHTLTSPSLPLRSILSLAPDDRCYEHPASALSAYIESYLLLISILPIDLAKQLTPTLCHELCSRASHNAFSIRPSGGTDGEQSGEFLGWGVWPEASFFNHSCARNVTKERRGRTWEFRTSRTVVEGGQLCITYLGGDEEDLDTAKRQDNLQGGWGFHCMCLKCAGDG